METGSLATIREYVTTSYEPDCDYVDGTIEERNSGEYDHAHLQATATSYLGNHSRERGIIVLLAPRIQVSPTRFRVPDVCVILTDHPKEQIFRTPPFICIEILSPEDRLSRVQEKMNDYLYFGVPYVWMLDPATRKAYRWTTKGMHEVAELRTENPEIVVPLPALFAD